MTSHDALLFAEHLTCGYASPRSVILSDISLALRPGRLVCVIGPNGAGKTTLIRTLSGLLSPLGGRVELAGRPVADMHVSERARRLSIVLTDLVAPGYLTVRRFVELGRYPYLGLFGRITERDRHAVDAAMAHTGVGGLASRWMTEISDGERQRAAVARALAQSADMMVLDEPTAFLDVSGRASLMTTLQRIAHDTNRLIVTTSHDVDLVLRTADLVLIVHNGGHTTIGSPEDIVLHGELDHLFEEGSLRFDRTTGTFRLPEPTGAAVRIVGSGELYAWTRHAVERIGLTVAGPTTGEPAVTITVPARTGEPWTVRSDGAGRPISATAASLAEVAEHLRR